MGVKWRVSLAAKACYFRSLRCQLRTSAVLTYFKYAPRLEYLLPSCERKFLRLKITLIDEIVNIKKRTVEIPTVLFLVGCQFYHFCPISRFLGKGQIIGTLT